jgi:HEAT repeat protein
MDRVQKLIEELRNGSPEVRRKVVKALGRKSDSRAIEALVGAFKDRDVSVRIAVNDSFARIGRPAIMALIKALADEAARFHAQEALKRMGKPAVNSLIEALKDEDTKENAKRALASMGELAIKPLVHALGQSVIQKEVANTLASMGLRGDPIEEPLLKALEDSASHEGAVDALVAIILAHLRRRIPLLCEMLTVLRRQPASQSLEGKISVFIPLLVNQLEGEASRYQALEALQLIGSLATPHLIHVLKDKAKNEGTRWCAARILTETKDRAGVEALIGVLEEENSIVRLQTIEALGKIGDERALKPLLVLALRDEYMGLNFAQALMSSPSLSQALASFNEKAASFFCARCFCRFEKRKLEYRGRRSVSIFSCRKCHDISHLIEDVEHVMVILNSSLRNRLVMRNAPDDKSFRLHNGGVVHNLVELSSALRGMDEISYRHHVNDSKNDFANWARDVCGDRALAQKLRNSANRLDAALEIGKYTGLLWHDLDKSMFFINWFGSKDPFDFDRVQIDDADDFEVEEFVMKIRNDADQWRQSRYRTIPVFLQSDNKLSQAKLNLLQGTFANVED